MWKTQWKWLVGLVGGFLICYYLPVGTERFNHAVMESMELVKWYAREHVLLCLVPAFFIAGAIGVFVSQGAVMRYLGPRAKKWLAYLVASVSGTILAVCSCTILPLFAGIYKMGAGLGPASAFLYSGPAINIMAIVLTARVLGIEIGIARAVGAIGLSVVIGVCMHLIFRREEQEKARMAADLADTESGRPLWQNVLYIGSMIAILVFANLGKSEDSGVLWTPLWRVKWYLTSLAALVHGFMLVRYYGMKWWKLVCIVVPVVVLALLFPDKPLLAFTAGFLGIGAFTSTEKESELGSWFETSWDFAKKIMPLLLFGGANREITEQEIDSALDAAEGGILLLQNEINSIDLVFRKAHERGIPVAFNFAPFDPEDAKQLPLGLLSYLIVNEIEGAGVAGVEEPKAILVALKSNYPNCRVILTLGKAGSAFLDDDGTMVTVPPYPAQVVDTTSAGDTFIGYLFAGLLERMALKEAMELATRASAITVSRPGAADSIPFRRELA